MIWSRGHVPLLALLALAACSDGNADPTSADPGGAASLRVNGGDAQSANAGAPVSTAPSVRVSDAAGNPVGGTAVTFAVVQGGGSVANASALTGPDGVASAGTWTLGPTTGSHVLEARVQGLPTLSFRATALSPYAIDLRLIGTFTSAQRSAVESAVARWRAAILSELPDATVNSSAGRCFEGQPAVQETVDDLLLFVSFSNIDGAGDALAVSGPCFVRNTGSLPVMGALRLDTSDLASVEQMGLLGDVILHEIGHALGIGTVWDRLLTGAGGSDPRFTGANAVAEYGVLAGPAGSVPVENQGGQGTRDGHWREATFGSELMTGFINRTANPLSRMTIASLADLGYRIDLTTAAAYRLPVAALQADPVLDLDLGAREELIRPLGRVGP
jgi:hypothetical protein